MVGAVIFGIMLIHDCLGVDRQEKQIKFDHALVAFMLYFAADCFWAAISTGMALNSAKMKSMKNASALGIRIIPVASSGVDEETEVILRSFALMTGGTYIYLTNDSGIGGYHVEASVSEKNVEPLNDCMVRVVCEYCGIEYEKGETPPAPQPKKVYNITYDKNLVNVLLDAPESATEGDEVEVRVSVMTDTDLHLYIGAMEIEKTHYDSDYWGYTFTMPAQDVKITCEFISVKDM